MRYYLYDKFGAYTGEHADVTDPYAPLPPMSTAVEPPTVTEPGKAAIFSGDAWFVGDAPVYDKTPADKLAAELAGLADGYQTDTLEFQRMLGTIMLADGPTEAAKISAIRTQWNARKAKYVSDAATVRAKYA